MNKNFIIQTSFLEGMEITLSEWENKELCLLKQKKSQKAKKGKEQIKDYSLEDFLKEIDEDER